MSDENSTGSLKDYTPVVGGCLLSISLNKPIRQKKTYARKLKPPAVKTYDPCTTAVEHIDRARVVYGEDVIDPDGKISHSEVDHGKPRPVRPQARNWYFTLPGVDKPPPWLLKGVDYLAYVNEDGLWKCFMRNYNHPVCMPYAEFLEADPVTAKHLQMEVAGWTAKTTFGEAGRKPANKIGGKDRWDKRRQYVTAAEEERLGDIPPRQRKKMSGKTDNVPTRESTPTIVHHHTYNSATTNIHCNTYNNYAGNGENKS